MLFLSRFLGDKPFFMGDKLTGVDATVYAWMSAILDAPFDSPLQAATRGHANLVSYNQRLAQRFFG